MNKLILCKVQRVVYTYKLLFLYIVLFFLTLPVPVPVELFPSANKALISSWINFRFGWSILWIPGSKEDEEEDEEADLITLNTPWPTNVLSTDPPNINSFECSGSPEIDCISWPINLWPCFGSWRTLSSSNFKGWKTHRHPSLLESVVKTEPFMTCADGDEDGEDEEDDDEDDDEEDDEDDVEFDEVK